MVEVVPCWVIQWAEGITLPCSPSGCAQGGAEGREIGGIGGVGLLLLSREAIEPYILSLTCPSGIVEGIAYTLSCGYLAPRAVLGSRGGGEDRQAVLEELPFIPQYVLRYIPEVYVQLSRLGRGSVDVWVHHPEL